MRLAVYSVLAMSLRRREENEGESQKYTKRMDY